MSAAHRFGRASTFDATRLTNTVADAWGAQLEGIGFAAFGMIEEGKSPTDCAWSVVQRRRDRDHRRTL